MSRAPQRPPKPPAWEGPFPRTKPSTKNFLKANVRELRQMQARNRQKEIDMEQERQQQTPIKPLHSEKYRRVRSKVAGMIKGTADSNRRGHSLTSLDKLQHRSCESGLGASRTPSPDTQATASTSNMATTAEYPRQLSQSMAEMSMGMGDDTPVAPTAGRTRYNGRHGVKPMVSVGTSTDDFWYRPESGVDSTGGSAARTAIGDGPVRGTISDREEMKTAATSLPSPMGFPAPPMSATSSCQTDEKDDDSHRLPLLAPSAVTTATSGPPTRFGTTKGRTKEDASKPPSGYQRGVVPRYLRDRQEGWKQDEKRRQEEEAFAKTCPPGHIPVSDEERLDTLRLLKTSYEKLIKELNSMPLCKDTVRIRQRKVEIEKQLVKLEEGIKVFSRPKVFIKVDS